ncbi:MAG: hypothetical protein EP307_11235 [Rhodobacteraceae bacterium]|nr:MAG: hypothetical protein EP307_11235 [Paracoccaceae bacterium]
MTISNSHAIDLADPDWTDAPERIVARLVQVSDGAIRINAGAAGPLLAPVAQILLAARNTARARGADLVLIGVTPACRDSMASLGLPADIFQHEEV